MIASTCTSCSSPIDNNSRFCPGCGHEVTGGQPPTSVQSALEAPAPLAPSYGGGQLRAQEFAPVLSSLTVNVAAPAQQNTVVIIDNHNGPGFLTRAIWFFFIGWWLTFWWIGLAWVLNATILGLPLGLAMINRVPKILTLRPDRMQTSVVQTGNTTVVSRTSVAQFSLLVRAVYFVLIGWWASLAFAYTAWALCVLIVTLPIGLIMFNYLPQVTTLRRN
jgi:uncharacterized membrane protein YccF (DUF307 family)